MKVAVTGASGFIGRHVLRELAKRPLEVVAVTRSAAHLAGAGKDVRVVVLDVGEDVEGGFERMGHPDLLIHLAWGGLPNFKSPYHFEVELPRQYRFLSELVKDGLPSLCVTGTCLEYGLQPGVLSEDLTPLPSTSYGLAKNALRQQLELLRGSQPFNLTWARLFYMYGEGQSETSLFSQLCNAVARGDRVFPMSGGEQLRDYLPAEEVARLIVELALLRANAVVNVCSGQPISVRRLVESWKTKYGWEIVLDLGYYPYPDYEPMAFWGDRNRLRSLLSLQ